MVNGSGWLGFERRRGLRNVGYDRVRAVGERRAGGRGCSRAETGCVYVTPCPCKEPTHTSGQWLLRTTPHVRRAHLFLFWPRCRVLAGIESGRQRVSRQGRAGGRENACPCNWPIAGSSPAKCALSSCRASDRSSIASWSTPRRPTPGRRRPPNRIGHLQCLRARPSPVGGLARGGGCGYHCIVWVRDGCPVSVDGRGRDVERCS